MLDETTDDMRSLLSGDELSLDKLERMEKFVAVKYNCMVDTAEIFTSVTMILTAGSMLSLDRRR